MCDFLVIRIDLFFEGRRGGLERCFLGGRVKEREWAESLSLRVGGRPKVFPDGR